MRKLYLLTTLLMLLVAYGSASADVQSPYAVDFNTSISTTAHDFKVAPGWGHIVSSYYDDWDYEDVYVDYTYSASNGVDGSGCLKIGNQVSNSTTDLLVTPAVTGKVTLKVKKTSSYSSGSIKFYTVTKSASGTYTKGSEITPTTAPDLSDTDFVTYELPSQSNAYVGIWGNYVYIDDFTAESADIVLSKGLTISSATLATSNPLCSASGKYVVTLNLTLKNTGELPLAVGDDNYSVTMTYGYTDTELGTANVTTPLAVGESATVTVSTDSLAYATYNGTFRVKVKENITGTESSAYLYVTPVAYVPKLVVRNDDGALSSGSSVSFGNTTTEVSKTFTVCNDGAAPLNITSITVPEGFTSLLKAPLTIAADAKDTLVITMPIDVAGVKSGNFVIKSDNLDDYTLSLSGTVLDSTKFYANFDDGQIPNGCVVGENWEVASGSLWGTPYVLKSTMATLSKFITPLLKVEEGEKMSFKAAKQVGQSNLNVYYSTDRQSWTLAKAIENDDFPSTRHGDSWSGNYYDFADFTLESIPAGNYYIAFESGYAIVDEIYGFSRVAVDHDLMITASNVPAKGMVNNKYTATATIKNLNTVAESSYTAALYFDDEVVAAADPAVLAAGASEDFTFTYTPHAAGTYKVSIKFTFGNTVVSTPETDVVISEEIGSKDVVVGDTTKATTSSMSPLSLNYKKSETESIYTADVLGLEAGDKITGLTYNGYKVNETHTTTVTVWLQNTEDSVFVKGSYAATPEDSMTQVVSTSYTFEEKGAYTNLVPMLQVTFDQPFVYTGKNLRVVVRSICDTYKSTSFEVENDKQTNCIYRRTDGGVLAEQTFSATYRPIVTMSVAVDPVTISGTVTDTYSAPIENAAVQLVSDDVIYNGTTDAQGNYSISVVQTGLTYTGTYSAEGYESKTVESIAFTDGASITGKDVQLAAVAPTFTVGQPALVCLPFEVSGDAATGKFYTVTAYESGVVTVVLTGTIPAGTPCVFVPATATPFSSIEAPAGAPAAKSVTVDGITLTGTYSAKTLADIYGISGADETSAALTGISKVASYGAYFSFGTTPGTLPTVKFLDEYTSITDVTGAQSKANGYVYTIDGRLVSTNADVKTLDSGLYIIGGKKVVVK